MNVEQEKNLISILEQVFYGHFKAMTLEELKCLDWLVLDADPFLEAKNKKAA